MDYNSWKPEDTFEIARQLGEKAKAGDVFCLIGDLGVGKTLFSQGFATGLGIQEVLIARHLQLCRSMMRADCLFIILTYIELRKAKRWKKLALRI